MLPYPWVGDIYMYMIDISQVDLSFIFRPISSAMERIFWVDQCTN